ncbi:MAG TPA: right-handed parallel beta-helix repeat-containing protein [Polyangiaceae bacterium]|nr:right-handed parallel beta-helix repeat-containing protein [Polyangiaceae bacterium]
MNLRAGRASVAFSLSSSLLLCACGSNESPPTSAASGQGPSGGDATSAGMGPSSAGAGGTSAGGTGANGGSSGSGQSQAGSGEAGAGPACAPLTTFETDLEPSAVLHVATTGNADGSGTEQDPFDTIAAAVGAAGPGTAVRVHAGQYAGDIFLSDLNGTQDAPIWIGGAPGEERPVIGGAESSEALHISGARYFVLHDLEITGTTGNGINLDDRGDYSDAEALRHVVLRNLSIYAIGTGGNNDCLKISGANDFFVLDSEFTDCSAGGSNIDNVGCHDGVIAGNSFVNGGTGVQAKGGSRNIEIRANVFRQNGGRAVNMGGATGFEFFRPPLETAGENYEATDVRVVANVFDRAVEVAAMPGCVDCLFAHNTVYLPTTRILRILQETTTADGFTFLPASNGRISNNLFVYTRAEITNGGRAINVGADTSPATFSCENNLWYASDDVAGSADVDYQGAAVSGTLAPADPDFADPSNGDFTLAANSPAVGAGVALDEVPQDHAGRCYATPPTVGAFERGP